MFICNLSAGSTYDGPGLKDFGFIGKRLFIIPQIFEECLYLTKLFLFRYCWLGTLLPLGWLKVFMIIYYKIGRSFSYEISFSRQKITIFLFFSLFTSCKLLKRLHQSTWQFVDYVNVWKPCSCGKVFLLKFYSVTWWSKLVVLAYLLIYGFEGTNSSEIIRENMVEYSRKHDGIFAKTWWNIVQSAWTFIYTGHNVNMETIEKDVKYVQR